MALPRVVQNAAFPPRFQTDIEKRFDTVLLADALRLEASERARIEGMLFYGHTRVTADVLDQFPGLRVISNHGVGFNHIDVQACAQRGVAVSNTPGEMAAPLADAAPALTPRAP